MTASENCYALIKKFEGCRLASYKDLVGIWTVGYGHTGPDVTFNTIISQARAQELLEQDVASVVRSIEPYLGSQHLSQNELDAVVAFTYNVGVGHLVTSTLLRRLKEGRLSEAADEFLRWNKAGGKVVAGLAKRRAAERELFLKGTV